ncbi:MAG: acetyl-CoA carboxylase, biotin carboxyl carrier protein [Gammaproteobacteria bacterium]|uniref:Biotin carboxyl carrier protein of acetyl-CoA carboxylase n=1 Tax=OM182 bacterium MED-G24 TaxID=1986255 RepID=A0A2A5WZC4_9GAMM|nr:acetyl-CoA carboxylase, biotin carboxyl carrier protein [Gammaproteobacteria bacterium]PDH41890.1 MAG: acetyl-CoA carboxylase, biotin carboxyl carrier protein [OM182 bacterium MED-G24]RPG27525.1 MAG: acetyl-CoA carboxylase biotin carboxyl carrier protein [Gammaproteobacteria bacterium TMED50]|tara:strand:- start:1211 stop:1660 length:450 start_codon:yes stop_codon:yes gene_type:complete
MDIRKIKKLIELMEESDLSEIEVREGDDSVRISRAGVQAALMVAPPVASVSSDQVRSPDTEQQPVAVEDTQGELLRAPMVGTFYLSPSPGSPPFVDVGSRVKVGDTLCIIESMKMMNEVKAEVAGVVEAVLVRNEDAVEFDQPIFTLSH